MWIQGCEPDSSLSIIWVEPAYVALAKLLNSRVLQEEGNGKQLMGIL